MSELLRLFPDSSAVRAVRFPTTKQALKSFGVRHLPIAYVVAVQAGKVRLIGQRRQDLVWETPVSSVEAISVCETRSHPPYPQVELAIVLSVRGGYGTTDIPIVPVSDDGKRSLTWKDTEVRALARRLSESIKGEPGVSHPQRLS
ncbi:hypothetical protein AB4Z18_08275 [Leifsonia sp. 2TAF2]|uniref:hypothetical protein n=1 Tax=Leifsonia sp. 2TAF2 TaxID=3233009 RepID=UPI003F97B326